jgi:N-acetylglutamate synthase-like GNAT family acetyltransferase
MRDLAVTLLDGADPLADELAMRHAAQWGHLYENWNRQRARAEFRAHQTDGSLPATLVRHENGQVAGSVSLVHGDCEARRDLDPWLASLYVFPEFRGRGHAHGLIEAAIRHAAAAGQKELYVFTESAGGLFRRHGFALLERSSLHGTTIEILSRQLPRPAAQSRMV